MIRFIDLGKQIGNLHDDWPREFAFFDTYSDRFKEFNGNQTWDCWQDFKEDLMALNAHDTGEVARYKRLCPSWVLEDKNDN